MRALRVLRTAVLALLYIGVSSSLLIFHGPYSSLREYIIDSLATTRHAYLLRPMSLFTLSQADINSHNPNLMGTVKSYTDQSLALKDYGEITDNSIRMETYTAKTFTANVMFIRDPKRIQVAVTSHMGNVGETVSQMVQEHGAVAGVNGGAFSDKNWQGTGGIPLGITIVNGKVIQSDPTKQPVIGLTANGALIAGSYTLAQVKALNVTQALSFGPVLVQNGQDMIQGEGGWGRAPRTAIGQTADGTIILIVTDGRFVHGSDNFGASLQDVAQLMLHYGAVVAANLDGGSSTTMVYQGHLVNQVTDILGQREVATAILVTPGRGNNH